MNAMCNGITYIQNNYLKISTTAVLVIMLIIIYSYLVIHHQDIYSC
jgi:hypothetical protein